MASAVEPVSDYPPPGMEVRLIERYVPLEGRRILEIGCGDGRLTRELAHLASSVVAIEPDASLIAQARRLLRSSGVTNVSFRVASAEKVHLQARFEVAIFSWSL